MSACTTFTPLRRVDGGYTTRCHLCGECMEEHLCNQIDALRIQQDELLAAARKLASWFKSEPEHGAFCADEHLLAGCANELAADVERLREAIANAGGGQ